jgi:hypothetical protein
MSEPYSFERDADMSFDESMREIEGWHEANPDPSGLQLAERLFWRFTRLWADDLNLFGDHIWRVWVGEAITAEQAAKLVIPLVEEVFGKDRTAFGEWVEEWLIQRGVDRDVCVKALGSPTSPRPLTERGDKATAS